MSDHAEHGVDNPAFDGGTENQPGCAKNQEMSRPKDDTGQEQKNPLLGPEDGATEESTPPAEPSSGRKSSSVEIARMFEHGTRRKSEKEGLREGFYTADDQPSRYKVDESDYESHRTTEFPHVQPILGSMHPVHVKKAPKSSVSAVAPSLPDVTEDPSSESEQQRSPTHVPYIMSAPDLETAGSEPLTPTDEVPGPSLQLPPPRPLAPKGEYTYLPAVTVPKGSPRGTPGGSAEGVTFSIGDDHDGSHDDQGSKLGFLNNLGQGNQEPAVSEGWPSSSRLETPHVKFSLGSSGSLDKPSVAHTPQQDGAQDEDKSKKKHSSSSRKHSGAKHRRHQELAMRRQRGSEVKMPSLGVTTEGDEAQTLVGSDLADMAAHRFHNIRGLRRHLISPNAMVSISKQSDNQDEPRPNLILPRRLFDHQPHEMFVELDELLLTKNEEYEWQEKARWIKFEEDVEENLSRWGKPHVASLSFHSLLELRQCIESGVILLDLEEEDLPAIVTRLVDQLVTEELLDPEQKGLIIRALLLKHRHVGDGGFALRRPSMANMASGERRPSVMNFFRSQSVVSNRSTSPYVLRKADLNGSVGSNLNTMATLKENSSSSSLPAVVKHHPHSPHSPQPKDHIHLDMADVENQNNVKNKMFNNVLQNQGNRVSFSAVPDVLNNEKVPNGEEDHHVAKDIHTIHTVAPPMKSRGSQVSLSSDVGSTKDGETGQSNIFRRIPKGAEATTVLVGNVELLSQPIMAFVRLSEGRYLNNVTEVNLPVRFIFLLMGPSTAQLDYHEIGRSISTLMANTSFHDVAYRAEDRIDLLDAINEFLDESIVLPPGEWDRETLLPIMDMQKKKREEREQKEKEEKKVRAPHAPEEKRRDPLKRIGRPFGGAIADIKERYPHYLSDIKDGLNLQCISAFFFIYFAALSPAITFGGLLTEKTNKWMGVSEMMVATASFGTIFSLISSQPITIAGFTGPLLVFEEGLIGFTASVGLDYMGMRFWSLMWMCVITLVVVAFEGGILVKYITRFTEEIFALLISLIFIIETFLKLGKIFQTHPLQEYYPPPWCPDGPPLVNLYSNETNNDTFTTDSPSFTTAFMNATTTTAPTSTKVTHQPNTALLSLCLCLATYALATKLKKFRNSKYLGRSARRALGDFGVPISILIFVLVDFFIKYTYTEKLDVPGGISPTAPEKRGWFINPLGVETTLPVWAMFAGIIPGLLIFILIFMETQITSIIINKPERNLKKGSGFHWDMMLLGIWALFAGLMGLPILSGATVRSVAHISALSVYSRTHAPGEKPVLEGVYEQRVTGLLVHILMGLSLLLGPVLRKVPLAVLFGVFLYMGVSSLAGLQFFDRVCILFMPRKYHGDASYVRKVKPLKMHLWTIIQVVCLGVLWAVKSTAASLAFPFILILTVPLRYFVLKFIFNPRELKELDNSGANKNEEEDEPDFYEQAHTLSNTNAT